MSLSLHFLSGFPTACLIVCSTISPTRVVLISILLCVYFVSVFHVIFSDHLRLTWLPCLCFGFWIFAVYCIFCPCLDLLFSISGLRIIVCICFDLFALFWAVLMCFDTCLPLQHVSLFTCCFIIK